VIYNLKALSVELIKPIIAIIPIKTPEIIAIYLVDFLCLNILTDNIVKVSKIIQSNTHQTTDKITNEVVWLLVIETN
jgi:hypothetical protein